MSGTVQAIVSSGNYSTCVYEYEYEYILIVYRMSLSGHTARLHCTMTQVRGVMSRPETV